ncbi:MAG: tetratricopeptide repeat protein [Alphaproteobacteria bacterium]
MKTPLLRQFQESAVSTDLSDSDPTVERAIKIVEEIESVHFSGRVLPVNEMQRAQNAVDRLIAFTYQNPSLQNALRSGQKLSPLEADAHGAMALCGLRGIGRMQGSLQTVSQLANIASTHNSPVGHYVMGLLNMELFNPPRYEEACGFFERAAETGHAGAEYRLALLHLGGMIRKADPQEGVGYLKLAEEKQYPKALHLIGDHNLAGGVYSPWPDYRQAFSYLSAAGKMGYAPAQHHLARLYRNGLGTERDCFKAMEYYSAAMKQGINDHDIGDELSNLLSDLMPNAGRSGVPPLASMSLIRTLH